MTGDGAARHGAVLLAVGKFHTYPSVALVCPLFIVERCQLGGFLNGRTACFFLRALTSRDIQVGEVYLNRGRRKSSPKGATSRSTF